jgi:hypothetical protein
MIYLCYKKIFWCQVKMFIVDPGPSVFLCHFRSREKRRVCRSSHTPTCLNDNGRRAVRGHLGPRPRAAMIAAPRVTFPAFRSGGTLLLCWEFRFVTFSGWLAAVHQKNEHTHTRQHNAPARRSILPRPLLSPRSRPGSHFPTCVFTTRLSRPNSLLQCRVLLHRGMDI